MIKRQILVFLLRWLLNSVFMWIALNLFADFDGSSSSFWLYAAAGLIFSLVNSLIKPLVTTLSLPLIIVSMGVFTLIINIAMVGLTVFLLPGVRIDFWGAALSALVISILNSLVNLALPNYNKK